MKPKWSSALTVTRRLNRKNPSVILLAGITYSPVDSLINIVYNPSISSVVIGWCAITTSTNSFYAWWASVLLLETEVMSTLLLFPGNYVSSFCLSAVRLPLCVLAKFFFTQGLPRFSFFNSCAFLGLKLILLTGRWSKIRRLNEAKNGQLSFSTDGGGQFLYGHGPQGSLALMRS